MRNAGTAGPDECDKAIDFTVMCDSFHIPIVYLHDTPGFLVGKLMEERKLATKVMVWKQANALASVPRLSIIVRKSIGAAYGAMMGPSQGADRILAWPSAEINFTGEDVGINIVHHREIMAAENPADRRRELSSKWQADSSPYRAAGLAYLDDVIDPRDTRVAINNWIKVAHAYGAPRSLRRLADWPLGF